MGMRKFSPLNEQEVKNKRIRMRFFGVSMLVLLGLILFFCNNNDLKLFGVAVLIIVIEAGVILLSCRRIFGRWLWEKQAA